MTQAEEELSERKKAELRLIAELTLDATLAAEEKLSKLVASSRIPKTST
ncbi:MAG: hypothetical protein ACRDF4_10775 [Rhabdochlamydiaceae bacterium]